MVIIDCRTNLEQAAGIFPNSILLDSAAFEDTEFMMNFPDQFMPMRCLFHFCLMGSENYKGHNFDLTVLSQEENSPVQNMMENLLQAFLMKGFSFLSIIEGGYEQCHHFALRHNITIENHDKNKCVPCQKLSKTNRLSPTKEKITSNCALRKSRECTEESHKILKEMINENETSPTIEKFLFSCQKLHQDICEKEEYVIDISNT